MTRFMFVLALLLVALVVGCQDDGTTNPLASRETTSSALAKPKPVDDIIIPLDGIMKDPDPLYKDTQILGRVVARVEGEGRLITLSLCTDAELWPVEYPEDATRWRVTCSGCERMKLPGEGGIVSFCKDFAIPGRPANIQLCVDLYILYKPGINFRTVKLEGIHIEVVSDPNDDR